MHEQWCLFILFTKCYKWLCTYMHTYENTVYINSKGNHTIHSRCFINAIFLPPFLYSTSVILHPFLLFLMHINSHIWLIQIWMQITQKLWGLAFSYLMNITHTSLHTAFLIIWYKFLQSTGKSSNSFFERLPNRPWYNM